MMELDGSLNSSGRPFLATGRGEGSRIHTLFAAVVPAGTTPGTVTPATGTEATDPLTVSPLAGTDLAILWTRYSAPEVAKGSAIRSITGTKPAARSPSGPDPQVCGVAAGPGEFRSGCGVGRPGCSPPRASR